MKILKKIYGKLDDNIFITISLLVYVFILLFFCSQMSPLYPYNTWADVNLYFTVGKSIFEGRTLYVDSFDYKGPLIFFIYGLGYLISNTSFVGIFLFQIIIWSGMMIAVYSTLRLFLEKEFAYIAVLLFPLFFFSFAGTGGSPEELVLALFTYMFYLFVRYFSSENKNIKPVEMLLLGVLSGAVFFSKMNLIIFCFFLIGGILVDMFFGKKYREFIRNIGLVIIGFSIVTLPIILYLYLNDALTGFIDIYILLNRKQSVIPDSIGGMIALFANKAEPLFKYYLFDMLLIGVGMFCFPLKFIKNRIGQVFLILSGVFLFFVIFMTYTYHFYYPLPLHVFVVPGLVLVFHFFSRRMTISFSRKLLMFCFVLCILLGVKQKNFYGLGVRNFFTSEYPNDIVACFKEIIVHEDDRSLVNLGYGSANILFTVCNIVPNVKYCINPNVVHENFPELRNEQVKYIENRKTKFIILTNYIPSREYFEALPALNEHYELVKTYVDEESYSSSDIVNREYYLYRRID